MVSRTVTIFSILLALFGVFVAPGLVTTGIVRRPRPIHRYHPDDGDTPWDLTGWIPVGFADRKEWKWMPEFRRVK